MRAAAIVVTHNSENEIDACLRALDQADARTWVVDNASLDGTVQHITEGFPGVRLLANPDNRGFARAVNQALAEVDEEMALLVNPDCIVSEMAVRGLAHHMASDPEVGVLGPRITDADGHVAISAHAFESAGTVLASRFGGVLLPASVKHILSAGRRRRSYAACLEGQACTVDWVSGACLAVRTDLLRELGGLDAGYFMYYEDEELCLQAWRTGATVAYLPTVEVVHAGGRSSGDPALVWPHLYRSLLRFQARHRPRTYWLVRAAILLRALIGVGLGAPRDAVGAARGHPGRRSLAWARVAAIALRGRRALVVGVA
jgi:GT2 family glycosyltransferase